MSDRYSQLVNLPVAGDLAKRIGLPQPVALDRYRPGDPLIKGRVLLGGAGRVARAAAEVLRDADADSATALDDPVRALAAAAGLDAAVFNPEAPADQRFKALVFDATGIERAADLAQLQQFFYPTIARLRSSGRVVVFGTPPAQAGAIAAATAQRALEGFTRSLAKEVGQGSTVQLVYVAPGAEDQIASALRFLLSPRSAYVSGQVIHVTPSERHPAIDWERPLGGRAALVTGASRGIGAAIAETLERDGARVIRLDMPGTGADIELDITAGDAPDVIAERCAGGLDILVHNAGITKDRTLAKMPEDRWQQVLDVNLVAQERINAVALDLLREDGRIVCVSSMSGIAGNAGQTNYAASKAGVIGLVQATAPVVAERSITINAVAPGFIETQMTAAMPLAAREAGRRMNSMRQGGLPVDVAETIAWFASPASAGVNGNVVRVCGQSLLGA
jgi:3-oxoacyl-[acyl-carrier protein] reductase